MEPLHRRVRQDEVELALERQLLRAPPLERDVGGHLAARGLEHPRRGIDPDDAPGGERAHARDERARPAADVEDVVAGPDGREAEEDVRGGALDGGVARVARGDGVEAGHGGGGEHARRRAATRPPQNATGLPGSITSTFVAFPFSAAWSSSGVPVSAGFVP